MLGGARSAGAGARLKALVVDDNDVNRMLIAAMLKGIGCEVDLVENGQKAVDAATDADYDVIFMDVSMPVMDGLEATRQIRATGARNAGTRIIAVTAHAMVGDKERFLASGMDGYISKPFRKTDLQAAIDALRKPATAESRN